MSLLEFSQDKYVKTFDDDEEIRMGSFQVVESGWLEVLRANIFISEIFNITGNETLVCKVYTDPELTSLYATSSEVTLSEVEIDASLITKTSYLGYLAFEFDQFHINKNYTYYPSIEISNYTRAGENYVGLLYDYPDPVYDNGATNFYNHPIAMQIFLKRSRP